jgi:hypothetical protein
MMNNRGRDKKAKKCTYRIAKVEQPNVGKNIEGALTC